MDHRTSGYKTKVTLLPRHYRSSSHPGWEPIVSTRRQFGKGTGQAGSTAGSSAAGMRRRSIREETTGNFVTLWTCTSYTLPALQCTATTCFGSCSTHALTLFVNATLPQATREHDKGESKIGFWISPFAQNIHCFQGGDAVVPERISFDASVEHTARIAATRFRAEIVHLVTPCIQASCIQNQSEAIREAGAAVCRALGKQPCSDPDAASLKIAELRIAGSGRSARLPLPESPW